ncbi:hypothetical protein D4764_14G0000860 [Takifugu flavidus]|uniref:Uncharacterized protein n=1 Tax=Takifugu flavidus TaxID=433684 RepID=A0A5C6P418_9TELE|nr:hypothetical protein D4764_14G0000860 [Takifugu flavidus]
MESQAEEKQSECVCETEVSGESENVEMVVEVTGESGEAGKRRNKRKSVMKDNGRDSKAGRLEDAAAGTDTSDYEYMSNSSELSNTLSDTQGNDFYPPRMYKSFLTQTKGVRGPDLPRQAPFFQSASLTDPEIFRLKKHMGKARKQLNL